MQHQHQSARDLKLAPTQMQSGREESNVSTSRLLKQRYVPQSGKYSGNFAFCYNESGLEDLYIKEERKRQLEVNMGGESVTGYVRAASFFTYQTHILVFGRRFTYSVNGCIAKFKSSVDAALALPIFLAAQGADASQINALDLSVFGTVRVDYFDDGEHIIVSTGFRLEQFKTHFETLGLKRCANGWMADIDQDDPDKIKDNLMDLCDHKKAEFVIRNSLDEMHDATPQPQKRLLD